MTYSYDPTKIGKRGKDQMRFELGDTITDGGADTCALADEEYNGILNELKSGKTAWLVAKMHTLEAILFKLSYQVDTRIDVLSYNLGGRAERWQKLYEQIRKQILANVGFPTMAESAQKKPPYFFDGMEENIRAKMPPVRDFPFRNMTQ